MGKLTGRSAISSNIDGNLLIHVVDTTGTPASFKATLSQLYAVFPKNSSAGAGDVDYVARWTAANELGKGIIQDDGTTSSINGATSATDQLKIYSSLDAALNIEATGTNGISITGDFGTSNGFGINSAVANGDNVYNIYGRLPDTNGTISGNYYGVFATGTQTNSGQTIGGDIYGVYGNARHTDGVFGDGAGNGGDLYGVYGQASYSNTTNPMHSSEKMVALFAYSSVSSGATAANGHGIQSQFDVDGTLTNGYSFYAGSSQSSGEITNYHAFYSNGCKATTCSVAYGLRLLAHTTGTTKWGIYQEGANDKNYFAGQLKLTHTSGTAGQFLKAVDIDGNAEWADVPASGVTATSGAAQRLAVFDGTDSIEGDGNFTYDGTGLTVTDGTDYTYTTDVYYLSRSESDDANLYLYGYGAGHKGEIVLAAANGTIASPTATANTDTIGTIRAFGYTDSVDRFQECGQLSFQASEDHTATAHGSKFIIETATNGSSTIATRYTIDGDGDHTFTGNVKVDGQAYSDIAATVTPSALAATIDWDNGNMQVLDLQTGGSVNTLTLNNPKAGASYFIKIIQNGGTSIGWPAAVKWAENDTYAGSANPGDIDAVALTYDGTNYLANYSLDYQ